MGLGAVLGALQLGAAPLGAPIALGLFNPIWATFNVFINASIRIEPTT